MRCLIVWCVLAAGAWSACSAKLSGAAEGPAFASHPPLRRPPEASQRPLPDGPVWFVDGVQGDDLAAGSQESPWKTIGRAAASLRPGDTLCLRGGTYYENVKLAVSGSTGKPITVRGYPGETAILDGGLREFYEQPAASWEPHPAGGLDEFRSTHPLPNVRNVVGSFGDSLVGLNTYYHALDLRAEGEIFALKPDKSDFEPVYCGPGLWYDAASGYVHARLAHTHLPGGDNYGGETDPRKLPLIIAPFRSVPLHLDGAKHVRLQNLVIRGSGYHTVLLDQASDVEFDDVTIWCGTNGVRAKGVQRLRMHRCGLYGNSPPWQTRLECGLNSYPGRTQRDITRYNTHTLLVAEANEEFDVYSFPFNDEWEIAHCEFTDSGSDGLYLGGVTLDFHHNLVENMTDDGIYLSPMYARPVRMMGKAVLRIHENYFRRCLTTLVHGGTEPTNPDTIYFYRNVIDLRTPVRTGRPRETGVAPEPYYGKPVGDHGSPPWPMFYAYHNTVYSASAALSYDMGLLRGASEERPQAMFNNILIHGQKWLRYAPKSEFVRSDGNLFWQPGLDPQVAAQFFTAYRSSLVGKKETSTGVLDGRSLVIDPLFVGGNTQLATETAGSDLQLQKASPAVDAGVDVPADWPDPLRDRDAGRPDIGALPLGAAPLTVGRSATPTSKLP